MNSVVSEKKPKRLLRAVLAFISIALFAVGGYVVYITIFQPAQATSFYGQVKLHAGNAVGKPIGQENAPNGLPLIRLEGEGGQYEVDLCTGAFTHITSQYGNTDILPIWSAHNTCGGDVVIYWEEGQRFMIGDREYVVTEVRTAPQVGGDTDIVRGMKGELILQSCTYDWTTMHMVAAEKVKTPEEIAAEKKAAEKAAKEKAEKEKASKKQPKDSSAKPESIDTSVEDDTITDK